MKSHTAQARRSQKLILPHRCKGVVFYEVYSRSVGSTFNLIARSGGTASPSAKLEPQKRKLSFCSFQVVLIRAYNVCEEVTQNGHALRDRVQSRDSDRQLAKRQMHRDI
jgi:hypothetical protein